MAIGGNAARIIKTLFAETTFGSLWYSGAITSTMRWLESLAVGVYVFDLTNSPIMVAVFLFLRWAPLVLFGAWVGVIACLLYTSPSPRDGLLSRMPSSA